MSIWIIIRFHHIGLIVSLNHASGIIKLAFFILMDYSYKFFAQIGCLYPYITLLPVSDYLLSHSKGLNQEFNIYLHHLLSFHLLFRILFWCH